MLVGIVGQAGGLPQPPDGKFLKPMALNCAEQLVKDAVARGWPGQRVVTIGRCAVLTEAHNGRAACHYCGPCHRGCITRSYFSSLNATLPAAQATGRLTLRPYSVVHSILYDKRTGRATGVRVIDGQTKHALEFRARIIFLNASTIESARILLNSEGDLANSSGQVGKNLMDHIMGGGANGRVDAPVDRDTFGNRPNGIYVPRFRNVGKNTSSTFVRGYGFQGGGGRSDWGRGADQTGFGAEFKKSLRGTARMGKDPKTSVLNAHNQSHDVPNLFITDGACMASTACQNPSITYMALTARAAAYAVDAMKRNEL